MAQRHVLIRYRSAGSKDQGEHERGDGDQLEKPATSVLSHRESRGGEDDVGAAKEPSQLLGANPDQSYDLTGNVVPDSIERGQQELRFSISDRDGSDPIPVVYTGTVPDPFRDGREVIVTGRLQEGTFLAERDSLITKCPSKFTE